MHNGSYSTWFVATVFVASYMQGRAHADFGYLAAVCVGLFVFAVGLLTEWAWIATKAWWVERKRRQRGVYYVR